MILSDVFERFAQDAPLSVMAQAVLENALSPRIVDQLFEDVAERQYTHKLLFSSIVDLMSVVVCRIRPSIHAAYPGAAPRPSAPRSRPSTTSSTAPRPAVSAALVRTAAAALGPGHRRPWAAAGRPGCRAIASRSSTATTCPGPSTGSRSCGPSGPGPCPARPWSCSTRGDAGHRRGPLRGRPRPGAVAAGPGPGDRRGRRTSGSPTATSARPDFLFGIAGRGGSFVIRQHASTLHWEFVGKRRAVRPDRDRQGLRADDPGHQRRGRGPVPAADHGGPGQADPGRGHRDPPADQPAGQGRPTPR